MGMWKTHGRLASQAGLVFSCLAVLFLLPPLSASAQPAERRKFALVVGINRYPHLPREKQLHWAVADAGKVGRMLIEEFDFPATNVMPLYDEEATRSRILRSLKETAARVGPGDVFVLFYSGHGTLFPDSKSEVLDETQVIEQVVDAETKRRRRLLKPDQFDSALCPSDVAGPSTSGKGWGNLILDDELFELFKEFTNKGCGVVLLSDSCNSGTLARGLKEGGGDKPKVIAPRLALGRDWQDAPEPYYQRALTRSQDDLGGRFIAFTAAKDQELAWESEREGGYFTQALVAAASGKSGVGTFECVFRVLKRTVKAKQSLQEPQMDTRFFRGDLTNALFLSYAPPLRLKVLVKITDTEGRDIPGAAFAVLREGVSPKARLQAQDTLLLGRSDYGGLYDSGCPQVASGTYWIVASKKGYWPYEEHVRLEANGPGVAVLRIKLARR